MKKNMETTIKDFLIKKIFKNKTPKNFEKLTILKLENMDSLGIFKLIISVESEFKIKFSDKEIFSKKFENFAGIFNLVKKKIANREKK